jgi:hypothetical protein
LPCCCSTAGAGGEAAAHTPVHFLLYISTYTHATSYEDALVMIDGGGSEWRRPFFLINNKQTVI